jgi:hypothetical protein
MINRHNRRVLRLFFSCCILFGFVLTLPCVGHALESSLGDATLMIPSPPGFMDVNEVSRDAFLMFQDMLPPANRLIAVFLPETDIGRLSQGAEAELDRYMTVHSVIEHEDVTLTKHEFSQLRAKLRKECNSSDRKRDQLIAEAGKRAGRSYSKRTKTDVVAQMTIAMQMGGVEPLTVDAETAVSIAMSHFARLDIVVNGELSEDMSTGTTVALLVKGKVVYLNTYRRFKENADTRWTRSKAQAWTAQMLAANETIGDVPVVETVAPAPPINAVNEELPVANETVRNSPVVEVPTPVTPIDLAIEELLAGQQTEFSLNGHAKAHGLGISLKYPSSWRAEEDVRAHVVQSIAGSDAGGISPSCVILVQELPSWAVLFLEGETGTEVIKGALREMLPPNASFLVGGRIKLAGEPGAWFKYYFEEERSGLTFGMYAIRHVLFYGGRMLVVQCSVDALQDRGMLEDAFTSYSPVFQKIANSILIHDKWAETASVSLDSDIADNVDEHWFFLLLRSVVVIGGIGLAAPLVARFILFRHPMTKPVALFFVVSFWALNVFTFTARGSTLRIHCALMFVAWASYAILRKKGSRQHDEPRKYRRAEQRERQEAGQLYDQEKQRWERERGLREQQARAVKEDTQQIPEDARGCAGDAREHTEEESRPLRDTTSQERRNRCHYARVLGVSGEETLGDLQRRYRELAFKYHPDRVHHLGDRLKEAADREMKEINEAFNYFKKYGM